jgi:hypothetical protein
MAAKLDSTAMKKVYILLPFFVVFTAVFLPRRQAHWDRGIQPPPRCERSNSVSIRAKRADVHYDTPWQAWSAKDCSSFIAMMRASGCPEQTLQDLVLMQMAQDYKAKCAAQEDSMHMNPEWWHSDRNHASMADRIRFWREQHLELSDRVHELLDVEYEELLSRFFVRDYTPNTWIGAEKKLLLDALLERFRGDSSSIRLGSEGWWTPVDAQQEAQLVELEKSKRTQLAALLTPAELTEYDMRNSDAAQYVRENLPPANSEREFQTMVKVALDNGLPETVRIDERDFEYAAAKQAADEAKAALQRKIEAALGAEAVATQRVNADEQAKLEEERQARVKAENEAVQDLQLAAGCADMAAEIGLDPALGRKLFEQLRVMRKDTDPAHPKLTSEQEKALVIQVAVEIMGEKGREFVKKMDEKYEH